MSRRKLEAKLSSNREAASLFCHGKFFAAVKQYELAAIKFAAAIKLDPDFKLAKQALKEIEGVVR